MISKSAFYRTGLDAIRMSGAATLLAPSLRGLGAIFMLHHILPASGRKNGFAPNAGLEVTPEFLDAVIGHVKRAGYRLVSLDEAAEVVGRGEGDEQPVAVFTLDDGYRDNYLHAWPVFRAHGCPFTIFVAPAVTDGASELWWKTLEHVIAWNDVLDPGSVIPGPVIRLESDGDRRAAYRRLYRALRALDPHRQTRAIRALAVAHGVDTGLLCRSLAMDWNEIPAIARDPLCSIGAHTVHHFALARLDAGEAMQEAVASRDRIAAEIGRKPTTFAYPYGDASSCGPRDFALIAEAGFVAAVTTRKGLLGTRQAKRPTALPRLSLNGAYQEPRHVETLLSGVPFSLLNLVTSSG
jgi:peptidoglycan/xylan/chitin deacetylase (PgdA/CDA1 family)